MSRQPIYSSERDQHKELWFYVPDYPAVRALLNAAYVLFGVDEWSAEPSFVRGSETDADVTVRGTDDQLARFWNWLIDNTIPGLMLEGREVRW